MKILEFLIFNKNGVCLFHKKNREYTKGMFDDVPISECDEEFEVLSEDEEEEERRKLIFGFCFALNGLCGEVSPNKNSEGFHTMSTRKNTIYQLSTPTGYKFLLLTEKAGAKKDGSKNRAMEDFLNDFYQKIFVPFVIQDPKYNHGAVVSSRVVARFVQNSFNEVQQD
eukprot:maker-scaffold_18-snap-gene-2.67-mRNA-1 protein AED:0.00 eAED:0.00 QI:0/1/0.5/1/1/1/2/28/167